MDWLVFVAGGSAISAVAMMAVAGFMRGPRA